MGLLAFCRFGRVLRRVFCSMEGVGWVGMLKLFSSLGRYLARHD